MAKESSPVPMKERSEYGIPKTERFSMKRRNIPKLFGALRPYQKGRSSFRHRWMGGFCFGIQLRQHSFESFRLLNVSNCWVLPVWMFRRQGKRRARASGKRTQTFVAYATKFA